MRTFRLPLSHLNPNHQIYQPTYILNHITVFPPVKVKGSYMPKTYYLMVWVSSPYTHFWTFIL